MTDERPQEPDKYGLIECPRCTRWGHPDHDFDIDTVVCNECVRKVFRDG